MTFNINNNYIRFLVINFISSLIIAYTVCYMLNTYGLHDVLYIGNLFGIYFLVIFGVNILVEENVVSNNYRRFFLALLYILVFDIVFIYLIPILFKYNMFSTTDVIYLTLNGVKINLIFNPIVYIVIFALIVLLFNHILYRYMKKLRA